MEKDPAARPPILGPLRFREDNPLRTLLFRIGLAVAVITLVSIALYFDRDGLRDTQHADREMTYLDVFYFTVVTLTTVGYGDIVPVSHFERFINAVVLAPIRIALWAFFLGTAYEVSVLRLKYRQEREMKELKDRLDRHVIVCGYGSKGRAIIDELIAHKHRPQDIVVIETNESVCAEAVKHNLVVLRGDASSEDLLKSAGVERARCVLIAPDRDDTATLICLTVRNLAPDVQVIASARHEENIKLLYGAGANIVVAPSVTGGRLMATAVRQKIVSQFIDDMLMYEDGLRVTEHEVGEDYAGMRAGDVSSQTGAILLGIVRGQDRIPLRQTANTTLQLGDMLVLLDEIPVPHVNT